MLTLMAGESPGIRVGREHGERFRRALVEAGAFDRSRKIISDGSSVYLPILEASSPSISRLREIADFEIIRLNFESEEPILKPEDILGFRPSFEIVGDIALIGGGGEDAREDAREGGG